MLLEWHVLVKRCDQCESAVCCVGETNEKPKSQAAKSKITAVVAIIHHALRRHYAQIACLPAFTEASPAVTLQARVWDSPSNLF